MNGNGQQKRNSILNWSFETAEGVILAAVDSVRPAVKIIEGPLARIDQLLCSSLDVVEQRVPSVYLPPQLVSSCTMLSSHVKVTCFLV